MLGLKGASSPDDAAGAAVDLGRGGLHELLEELALPQPLVQPDHGDGVGLVPVLGILPALGDHALGGEVHHVVGLELVEHGIELVEIAIEVQLPKGETVVRHPPVRQEDRLGLGRAAGAEHFRAGLQQARHEAGARKTVAADDQESFVGMDFQEWVAERPSRSGISPHSDYLS